MICILANQSHNISKSTAFIVRQGQLYVVQLFYTNRKLGTETDRHMFYAPAGSAAQAASIHNNLKVANDVQAHEKEVRARRKIRIRQGFKFGLQNAAPYTIDTENARYGFFKLNNPRGIEEKRRYFILNFDNENGELCTAKFTNCFGNVVDDIKNNRYI